MMDDRGRKRFYHNHHHQDDPTNPPQSRVVHVRNLVDPKINEADICDALRVFGPISYVALMPSKQMALVEFEDQEAARQCVAVTQESPIEIGSHPALFNYSTSQIVQRGPLESEQPGKVISIVVTNVVYPVNVRVLHKVCSPYGTVKRIAVIRRYGVQALVEFDSIESARKAKREMNGADLYPGSCTFKVEFAKPGFVKVYKNSLDQWDFTTHPDGPPTTWTSGNSAYLDKPNESVADKEQMGDEPLSTFNNTGGDQENPDEQQQQQAPGDPTNAEPGGGDAPPYNRPAGGGGGFFRYADGERRSKFPRRGGRFEH